MIFYSLHRNPQTPQAQPDLHQPSLGDSHVVNCQGVYQSCFISDTFYI